MSQEAFERRHRAAWRESAELIDALYRGATDPRSASFPERYRRVCQQLALARHRRYGAEVVQDLNRLALQGHNLLYGSRSRPRARVADFVGSVFPRAFRKDARLFALACLLFVGPLAAADLAVHLRPELIYSIVDPATVAQFEAMYDPASDHYLRERPSDSDLLMFGFYIRNNIGIGFRTFASGALLGLGTAFFLVFNGVVFGAIAGHVDGLGYGSTFYGFVIGHGAFELTAIVIAGMAGMKLGLALLAPGRRTRRRAFLEAAREAAPLVYGFAGMLVLAAFVEAFWSSRTGVPFAVKLAVGGALWAAVAAYLALAGRGLRRGPR